MKHPVAGRLDKLALIAPALLALAHLTAGLALLTFGMRAGGYPLHLDGLRLYLAAAGVAAVAAFAMARREGRALPAALDLLLIQRPR